MNKEFKDAINAVMSKFIPYASNEWVTNTHQALYDAGLRLLPPESHYVSKETHDKVLLELKAARQHCDDFSKLADEREKALKLAEGAERKALSAYHKAEAELSHVKATSYYNDWTRGRDEVTRLEKVNAYLTECNNRLS